MTTIRNIKGAYYYLSNYSDDGRWWWINENGSGADIGPFNSRREAVDYSK